METHLLWHRRSKFSFDFREQTSPNFFQLGSNAYWSRILIGFLAAGTLVKLCRILVGAWQLRRWRKTSVLLTPLPDSIRSARRMVRRDASFRVSAMNVSPGAFGFCEPIVLVPESFLTLDEDAQRTIACHELLHVRRNDWLMSLTEELIGAVLWFQPAIWWLLGEIRLAREQVVDADVIRLTSCSETYIDALLTIASVHSVDRPMTAPSFFRRTHLVERMRLLVSPQPTSRWRLGFSYALLAILLVAAGTLAFCLFPLIAQSVSAQVVSLDFDPTRFDAVKDAQSAQPIFKLTDEGVIPPRLVSQIQPQYSDSARESRIRGSVMLEGTVENNGSMSAARVVRSLHPELDHNAVYAFRRWRFEPATLDGIPVRVQLVVEVGFNLR